MIKATKKDMVIIDDDDYICTIKINGHEIRTLWSTVKDKLNVPEGNWPDRLDFEVDCPVDKEKAQTIFIDFCNACEKRDYVFCPELYYFTEKYAKVPIAPMMFAKAYNVSHLLLDKRDYGHVSTENCSEQEKIIIYCASAMDQQKLLRSCLGRRRCREILEDTFDTIMIKGMRPQRLMAPKQRLVGELNEVEPLLQRKMTWVCKDDESSQIVTYGFPGDKKSLTVSHDIAQLLNEDSTFSGDIEKCLNDLISGRVPQTYEYFRFLGKVVKRKYAAAIMHYRSSCFRNQHNNVAALVYFVDESYCYKDEIDEYCFLDTFHDNLYRICSKHGNKYIQHYADPIFMANLVFEYL